MAITPTIINTVTSTSSGTTLSLNGITMVAGTTLHVALSHDPVSITSVMWGGNALTQDVTATNGDQISQWTLHNCPAGTNDLVVTFASAITNKIMKVSRLVGEFLPLVTDVVQSNIGTGTATSSGTTATPTYKGNLSYATVGRQSFGAWTTPHVDGKTLTHANLGGGTTSAGTTRLTCGVRGTDSDAGEEATAGVTSGIWASTVALYTEAKERISTAHQHKTQFYKAERIENTHQHKTTYFTERRIEVGHQHKTLLWIQRRIEVGHQHRTIWYREGTGVNRAYSQIF